MIPITVTTADLMPLLPELVLVGAAFALLLFDLFTNERRRGVVHALSVVSLIAVAAMLMNGTGGQGTVLNGMFIRDTMADALKFFVAVVSAMALIYSYDFLKQRGLYKSEIPVLMLFSTAGMMLLISAGNLVMVYLGLEMLALCSYALVAIDRDNPTSSEAAMKYFVLGSLASGLLLYGMSLVYGATGSLELSHDPQRQHHGADAADRHGLHGRWYRFQIRRRAVPHVAAGRVPRRADADHVVHRRRAEAGGLRDGVSPTRRRRRPARRAMAFAARRSRSLVVDSRQSDRAGADESQAHARVFDDLARRLFVHGLIRRRRSRLRGCDVLRDFLRIDVGCSVRRDRHACPEKGSRPIASTTYKGLNARNPWMAGLILCVMASLAGVPPFLGFWSKLAVLRAAWEGGQIWLVIVGIVFAVIGAFYYLRVIKAMYFDEAEGEPMVEREDKSLRLVFAVNALALFALGISWSPIMAWCQRAFA